MDINFWVNSLLVTLMLFAIVMLFAIMWWVIVFVLYAPSFRLRKLRKLIREDNMEFNEILAEKSRLHIEKANTQLQYDKLVIKKAEVDQQIKENEKLLEKTKLQLRAETDSLNMLNEFLNTPAGKKWLAVYSSKLIAEETLEQESNK